MNTDVPIEVEANARPSECRYHGAYVCTTDGCEADDPTAVARPQPGSQAGRCTECGEPKEFVNVARAASEALSRTEGRDPFENTFRLTEVEAVENARNIVQEGGR